MQEHTHTRDCACLLAELLPMVPPGLAHAPMLGHIVELCLSTAAYCDGQQSTMQQLKKGYCKVRDERHDPAEQLHVDCVEYHMIKPAQQAGH